MDRDGLPLWASPLLPWAWSRYGVGGGVHTESLVWVWGVGCGCPGRVAICSPRESSLPESGFWPREGFGLGAQRPGAHWLLGAKSGDAVLVSQRGGGV